MRNGPSTDTPNARDRILDAAIEVLARRGYAEAGVQEIVERSGTSKGGFYFHFPTKEKMVMVLVNRMSDKFINKVQRSIQKQPTPLARVAVGIESLIATFSRQRKVAQVLLLNIMGHGTDMDRKFLPIRDRFSTLLKEELDAAVAQGQIGSQDTALVAHMWMGALHDVILRWLLTGQPNPLTSTTPALQAVLLRSIGAPPTVTGS